MGVTTGYTQPLTSGVVNPGQMVDLTVNLTSPASSGTYTGYWRFRDPGGVLFGITPAGGTFLVKIVVVASETDTLTPVAAESGTVRADAGPFPDFTAGESNSDITKTCEAFLSFDISGIPAGAKITQVKINFQRLHNHRRSIWQPGSFEWLCQELWRHADNGRFCGWFPKWKYCRLGLHRSLKIGSRYPPELKAATSAKLGTDRFQLRLQFAGSNGDAVKDRITFNNPSLIVTYIKP